MFCAPNNMGNTTSFNKITQGIISINPLHKVYRTRLSARYTIDGTLLQYTFLPYMYYQSPYKSKLVGLPQIIDLGQRVTGALEFAK